MIEVGLMFNSKASLGNAGNPAMVLRRRVKTLVEEAKRMEQEVRNSDEEEEDRGRRRGGGNKHSIRHRFIHV